MKNIIIFSLVIIAIIVGLQIWPKKTVAPTTGNIPSPIADQSSNPSESTIDAETFTLSQVAEHNSKDSCWLVLEGKVYDVTSFVQSGLHPGREAILQGCGKDATELFNTRPMAKSPSPHSERARAMLPKYYIGELAL